MKPLLILLDFINDIVHPEGKIAAAAKFIEENQVLAKANTAVRIARNRHWPIVHVKVGFSPSYVECPAKSPLFGRAKTYGALKLGDWGTEFHEQMDVQAEDVILIKHRVSALYATPLATLLSANAIDTVIIAGVSTNMAVETLARELHDRDFNVLVLKDACAAATQAIHEASLETLARIAKISDTSELEAIC